MESQEIKATWGHAVRIWWALIWRNVIAVIVTIIVAGVAGFLLGFLLGFLGVPIKIIEVVSGAIGAIIGIAISVVPVKMIIGKNFRNFRLAIVPKNE